MTCLRAPAELTTRLLKAQMHFRGRRRKTEASPFYSRQNERELAELRSFQNRHSSEHIKPHGDQAHASEGESAPCRTLRRRNAIREGKRSIVYHQPYPTKHDLAGLVSKAWIGFSEPADCLEDSTPGGGDLEDNSVRKPKAWKGAILKENCLSAFRQTGVFPLSLDIMLSRSIGRDPAVHDLPNVKFLTDTPQIDDRQKRKLKRVGISIDALSAAFLGLKQLMVVAPQSQPKRQRTFVEGGILMTRPEMVEAVAAAEAARKQKAAQKDALAKERARKKELKYQEKAAKAAAKKTAKKPAPRKTKSWCD